MPTIGWLTWHMGWWWTVTIDHLRDHTVTHTIGWVNAELMNNVAEIGQLRLMRAAQPISDPQIPGRF
ncbi:hypothetical protein ACWD5Z_22890 [Micromonospora chokoriensis]